MSEDLDSVPGDAMPVVTVPGAPDDITT